MYLPERFHVTESPLCVTEDLGCGGAALHLPRPAGARATPSPPEPGHHDADGFPPQRGQHPLDRVAEARAPGGHLHLLPTPAALLLRAVLLPTPQLKRVFRDSHSPNQPGAEPEPSDQLQEATAGAGTGTTPRSCFPSMFVPRQMPFLVFEMILIGSLAGPHFWSVVQRRGSDLVCQALPPFRA